MRTNLLERPNRSVALRIDMLGRFAASYGGAGSLMTISRRARAILSYLAMHQDEPIEREQLADLLWVERRDRDPRHNLRQCLMELRKSFEKQPEILDIRRNTVTLRSAFCIVDAVQFKELAEAKLLEQAASLYKGDFLRSFYLDSEPFTVWLRTERSVIADIAGNILSELSLSAIAANQGSKAIGFCEKLTTVDPLREDWQRLLLQVYARFRGRNHALAYAHNFVSSLRRDLNVSPEIETMLLIDNIRQRSPSSAGKNTVSNNLENLVCTSRAS